MNDYATLVADSIMKEMEVSLTEMHNTVNTLYKSKKQLEGILSQLKNKDNADFVTEGQKLLDQLTQWDEKMVQRKTKAYDDVENFPNKFTSEYIFLINETESPMARVNEQNKARKIELDKQWVKFKAEADAFLNKSIPEFNKKLWEFGIGAISLE